jgi:hypothetical protein
MGIELASLVVGDEPSVWASLGFVVENDRCHVSGVAHTLTGGGRGVRAWSLRGTMGSSAIDGLPAAPAPDLAEIAQPTPAHPNGVIGLDHLVVSTPDLHRTIDALTDAGLDLRRTRDAGRETTQAFFKLGDVILELVGPNVPRGDGPPRFFGLAWTVRDLDETAAVLGERLRPAKAAVQPGRRIATLDRELGHSSVSMAFMSAG